MQEHVQEVLIDRETIAARVHEMAQQIAEELRREGAGDEPPQITLVAILTGSLIFLADLIRHLPVMMRIRLITVSSYPGAATASHGAELKSQLPDDLTGQHVLVVDDILDSGQTIGLVRGLIERRGPASVRTCMLLRKQREAAMRVPAEHIGFDIPDAFVVGYGLDYDGFYRNLPDVVTLKPEVLEERKRP